MPAIRDYTSNYNATTTATTIVMSMPELAANDLLLAIFSTDTTAQTWTATGWTVLNTTTNTVNLTIMYKIATGSEVDTTFTHSAAETVSGVIISIRDVNTTNPFGATPVVNSVAQASAAKFAMQSITTNVNNALIIYAVAHSDLAVPSLIEGPVTLITGQDGTAESLGVAWGFKATAGATSSAVTCSTVLAAVGVKAAIQIAPPSGGATVIPAYCAADLSTYVNPINGTTAYNGDGALAATATTNFGTTLNGKTLGNGTVGALADYGINSYHSVGQLTGVATSGVWSGANLLPATANKPNVTGKNVLVHAMPSTPKQLQTTDSVTLDGAQGIAIGMQSTASNLKWWHTHGANTAFGEKRTPMIINSLNTAGVIQTTGTLNAASIAAFGFAVSGKVVAPVWTFSSLWVLDTTTIAGGNSAEPIKVPGIISVYADGHERLSALQQGKNQGLFLGPIQIGDGGTNPSYLDLDSSAIEFPQQYNKSQRQVFYCSADNVAGITYYPGASDTIKHTNAVISSLSKYHWKVHSSASTSATYSFSGLQIIGAGTIQLRAGVTFNGITFASCDEVPAIGATITNCSFKTTTGLGSLNIASNTEMSLVTNCTFSSNAYGIRLMSASAATYTFSGIKFSGNTKDIYVAATTGTVTINITNGGDTPTYNSAGATVVINNSKVLTLTGIKNPSEVMILAASTITVLASQEDVTTGTFTYTYGYVPGTYVDIVVHNVTGYNYFRLDNVLLASSDSSIPISQVPDRNYSNPI